MEGRGHIHVFLLSGFLGAGKTTLLQRFLNRYSYQRIAVLKNEYGEANIDAEYIRQLGFPVKAIANGSIFCTCRHDAFIDAMRELAAQPIDTLFIEGSGMADPASFAKDLQLLWELEGPIFHHMATICLVDATSFLELVELLPAIANQVRYSNVILLNKTDLVRVDDLSAISDAIIEINPEARIFPTQFADLDFASLETVIDPFCLPQPTASCNNQGNRLLTLVLRVGTEENRIDPQRAREFFREYGCDTLRIKGFIHGPDSWLYVDGVQEQVQITPITISPFIAEIVMIFRPQTNAQVLSEASLRWQRLCSSR